MEPRLGPQCDASVPSRVRIARGPPDESGVKILGTMDSALLAGKDGPLSRTHANGTLGVPKSPIWMDTMHPVQYLCDPRQMNVSISVLFSDWRHGRYL